jgi:hypothetical protein
MLTSRYELKFLVTASQKERFLEAARQGLAEDPHGSQAVYWISSLYFDTPWLGAYWDKLDGVRVRKKFRLRRYALRADGRLEWSGAFMEIKHRRNNTIYKERVQIREAAVEAILADPTELTRLDRHLDGADKLEACRQDRATLDAITRAAAEPGFRATAVVCYRREAWLGVVDPRLRVTFDSGCRACEPMVGMGVELWDGQPILRPDLLVMEVKFDRAIPVWIREIVAAQGLRQQRISKYAASVDALKLRQRLPAGLRRGPGRPPEQGQPAEVLPKETVRDRTGESLLVAQSAGGV